MPVDPEPSRRTQVAPPSVLLKTCPSLVPGKSKLPYVTKATLWLEGSKVSDVTEPALGVDFVQTLLDVALVATLVSATSPTSSAARTRLGFVAATAIAEIRCPAGAIGVLACVHEIPSALRH